MSKLQFDGSRIDIDASTAEATLIDALLRCGCDRPTSASVATHLVDASLCGVESHGVMRILQYTEQFNSGYLNAKTKPVFRQLENSNYEVNGNGCIGIPTMELAVQEGCALALQHGIAALAIRDTGHTGRLGAYAETAALQGCLTIIIGGGNRKNWRQVAPHGGRQAKLPTNPYCIGIPGGERGPVILDFATSIIAGGWIYAADSAGAKLPEGVLIDKNGRPSIEPKDYYQGGAILPAAGAKGYALGLIAELIAEAMLGPATTECNWLMITLNTHQYRHPSTMQTVAEEILQEMRQCPPVDGFVGVEVPGERERAQKAKANGTISIPEPTWQQILALIN